jgi:hypothetical protein
MPEIADIKKTKAFGDFQTPTSLSVEAITCIKKSINFQPATIIEPTCGKGSFLLAAIDGFPVASKYLGVEINSEYFCDLNNAIQALNKSQNIQTLNADFFTIDWKDILKPLPDPILITGNPPWVTNSNLGVLDANNLPTKKNFQGRVGLDAITGKANFDISEWMLLQYLDWLSDRKGAIAILCKTAVARKILSQIWKQKKPIEYAAIHHIDALSNFGASVDACLFIVRTGKHISYNCSVYKDLSDKELFGHIGYKDGLILSDIDAYTEIAYLQGRDEFYTWRSGIKHDCSRIMELDWKDNSLSNGLGQLVYFEGEYVYPLLKSSDLGNGRVKECRKKVLVTQHFIGEDTALIEQIAPKTWKYLQKHSAYLSGRKSSIYKKRPPFSIFGVGEYSFSPWKVAISALYKRLKFFVVGSIDGKSVMFDDTVYFVPCQCKEEAEFICALLNSDEANSFLESMIFWEDKRPITIDVLKRLSLRNLALSINKEMEYINFTKNNQKNKMVDIYQPAVQFG